MAISSSPAWRGYVMPDTPAEDGHYPACDRVYWAARSGSRCLSIRFGRLRPPVLPNDSHNYPRGFPRTGGTPLEGGKDMDGTTRRWPRILLAVIGKARTPAEGRSLGGGVCAVLVATLTAAVGVVPPIRTPAAHAAVRT